MSKYRLLVLVMAFCQGCFDTEVAGTSTTTGNTINAYAMQSNGQPAAGARVQVRESGFIPSGLPGGNSTSSFYKEIFTDSLGRFRIVLPKGPTYFLSIRDSNALGSEVYWMDKLGSAMRGRLPDTLVLAKVGKVKGVLTFDTLGTNEAIWVGFPGTELFAPVSEGRYALNGLPPGDHKLTVLRRPLPNAPVSRFEIQGWNSLSDTTLVIDTLLLPRISGQTLTAYACLENPQSIVESALRFSGSNPNQILRSVLLSSPSEWIDIDFCQGKWSHRLRFSVTLSVHLTLFTGPYALYLHLTNDNHFVKMDSLNGLQELPIPVDSFQFVDYRDNRFYGILNHASVARLYADESTFLAGHYLETIPLPLVAFQQFSVGDSAVYYLTQTDSTRLRKWDRKLGKMENPITLPFASGVWLGMSAGVGWDLWLLNENQDLFWVNGKTGALRKKIRMNAGSVVTGLSRNKL